MTGRSLTQFGAKGYQQNLVQGGTQKTGAGGFEITYLAKQPSRYLSWNPHERYRDIDAVCRNSGGNAD